MEEAPSSSSKSKGAKKSSKPSRPRVVLPGDKPDIHALAVAVNVPVQNNNQEEGGSSSSSSSSSSSPNQQKKYISVTWAHYRKQYQPYVNDEILGTVVGKRGDFYKLDIGASSFATLSNIAFNGATKRSRPNVDVGDVIFCRVEALKPDLSEGGYVVTCEDKLTDPTGQTANLNTKGWSTGENVYQVLSGSYNSATRMNAGNTAGSGISGYLMELEEPQLIESQSDILENSSNIALQTQVDLSKKYQKVLGRLGKIFAFEASVGQNRRIWIKSQCGKDTVTIVQFLQKVPKLTEVQIEVLIQRLKNEYGELKPKSSSKNKNKMQVTPLNNDQQNSEDDQVQDQQSSQKKRSLDGSANGSSMKKKKRKKEA